MYIKYYDLFECRGENEHIEQQSTHHTYLNWKSNSYVKIDQKHTDRITKYICVALVL